MQWVWCICGKCGGSIDGRGETRSTGGMLDFAEKIKISPSFFKRVLWLINIVTIQYDTIRYDKIMKITGG